MTVITSKASQDGAWGRQDNGSETSATFFGAQNSNWTQPVNTAFRVRILINGTFGVVTLTPQLYFSRNSGAYTAITSSSTFCKSTASAFVTDGTATTLQMSGNDGFQPGVVTTADAICPPIGVSTCASTEEEFCLTLVSTDGVVAGDTFDFQIRDNAGAATIQWTVTNRATASSPTANSGFFFLF